MNEIKIKYQTVEAVARLYNIKTTNLFAMYHNKTRMNCIRFKKFNSHLYIAINYTNPLREIVNEKYYEALKLAPCESSLAFQLSCISGMKQSSIYKTLRRFSFARFDTTIRYMVLFDEYIEIQKAIEELYIEALSYTEDIDILCEKLSIQTGLKISKLKISLLNDIHKINLFHLKTILKEYIYEQKVKNVIPDIL